MLRVSFLQPPGEEITASSEKTGLLPVPTEPPSEDLDTTGTYLPEVPTIEGYQIVRELGRGGMGVVYLAGRLSDSSQVALKTIRPAVAGSPRQVQRFLSEAAILRELRHPNIVAFHEMGRAGDLLYFVMEYVPGDDAAELLKHSGPMAIGRAVRLICDVLEALQYAHGQNFVHRDVKPSNLLLSGEEGFETCKLADFGLARVYHGSPLSGLTIIGDAGGTIPYMPPEQITHYRNPSPSADQYSTAATLYRLLTDHYLFDFAEVPNQQRLEQVLCEEPVPIRDRRSDIPDPLAEAIHRALEKDPASRFPDAAAFRNALLPFGGEE